MASSMRLMMDVTTIPGNALHEDLPSFPYTQRNARKRWGFHGVDHRSYGMTMDSRRFLGLRAVRSLDWPDSGGILPFDVALLSDLEIAERQREYVEYGTVKQCYMAMYTKLFRGTTTDPAATMIDREQSISDTASTLNGFLSGHRYLDQLLSSASMAKIFLPFDLSTMRNILIQLLRSAKPDHCSPFLTSYNSPALFVVRGAKVIMSLLWIKLMDFALMKTMITTLFKMEANGNGAFAGIRLGNTSVKQGKKADEMMLIRNGIPLNPGLQRDNCTTISDDKDGPIGRFENDIEDDEDDDDDDEDEEDDEDDEEDDEDEDDEDDEEDDDDECECDDEDDDEDEDDEDEEEDDDDEECVLLSSELYKLSWSQSKSSLFHSMG